MTSISEVSSSPPSESSARSMGAVDEVVPLVDGNGFGRLVPSICGGRAVEDEAGTMGRASTMGRATRRGRDEIDGGSVRPAGAAVAIGVVVSFFGVANLSHKSQSRLPLEQCLHTLGRGCACDRDQTDIFTQSLAVWSCFFLFRLYSCAMVGTSGSDGLGSVRREERERRTL